MTVFNHTLGVLVGEMERVENAIYELEKSMRHASPATVNAIRSIKAQLEGVWERVMKADMTSTQGLQELLIGTKVCMQNCFDLSVMDGKQGHIERTRNPI